MKLHICENCGIKFEDYNSRIRRFCSKKCLYKNTAERMKGNKSLKGIVTSGFTGRKHTLESRLKVSFSCLGINKGRNNGNWKGGKCNLRKQIIQSSFYKWWRHSVFVRDNYTCVECHKIGGKLHVHHIKTIKDILKQSSIVTIEDAFRCKELWDINNGVTLCFECHQLKHPTVNVLYLQKERKRPWQK